MQTVREIFRRRAVKGDLGIEIEVEGRNIPATREYWRNEFDGSLRAEESREFVLDKPDDLAGVRKALDYLDDLYKKNKTVVDDSIRAGVHVHVNCQKLTALELYNYMTLYLTFENVLVRFCGEHREGNLFCLRAKDAEYLTEAISEAAILYNFNSFQNDIVRYASMNVVSLTKYGSLEFRAMRGTRDLDLIYTWAAMLLHLREVAKTFKNPRAIIEEFSVQGPRAFFLNSMEPFQDIFKGVPNIDKDLIESMRYAQDIAYCTEWEGWGERFHKIGGVVFNGDLNIDEIMEPPEDM